MRNRNVHCGNNKALGTVECLLTLALIIFCYFSFNHGDILATSTHGKDLLECVLNGNFFEFYDYTQSTAVYSIVLYVVFAIWSVPVFVVYTIMGVPLWGVLDYHAIPYAVLMWYKLLPTICYFAIAYILYKIGREINLDEESSKWVSFLFISSPIAMFSQFVFGQYDAIGLLLTVLALYMYIKKKYYWFSIFCSFAIAFKLFAVFFFIPLVLLFEKRLLHIIKHGAIGLSVNLITSIMFLGSKGHSDALGFSEDIMPRLFMSGIETIMGTISLFTLAMMVICVITYKRQIESEEDYYALAVYIPFFVYGALFAFILWHPQWVIWMIPFMSLAIVLVQESNSSMILHSAMSIGYLGTTIYSFNNNVDANMMAFGFFPKLFGEREIYSIINIITLKGLLDRNLFYSLFAGSILILLAMYFPCRKKTQHLEIVTNGRRILFADKVYTLFRPLTLLYFIIPALYRFFQA